MDTCRRYFHITIYQKRTTGTKLFIMSKTIMVLPGTLWQVALIDKIKELGHRAIVVNPAPDSPAFSHADDHLQSDIFNRPAVIKYGKENHVDGVMSDQCDIAMNLIAELGQEFKVPTLDTETASLFTDKFKMREFCREHQLPYPEYKLCKTADEAIELLVRIGKPIIIKPLDSNASHGVFKCETPEDIRNHFDDSMSFSRVEKYVLAERFITGTEFTIDSVKTPHGHYPLAISQKHHFAHNPNIANQLFFTHDNPNYDYDELRRVNNAFVNQTNLQFGFTHAEYKYEDGKYTASAICEDPDGFFYYKVEVTVTIKDGAITKVSVDKKDDVSDDPEENEYYLDQAVNGKKSYTGIPKQVIDSQSASDLDTVSRATYSSNAIIKAVKEALEDAKP